MRFLERFNEPIYALFRIVFGLLFASHGAQKAFGWFLVQGQEKADSLPLIAAGWFEIIAGLLIAIGLFTAIVALLACIEMAGAAILAQGEASVLYCFAFLYMASRESGMWSVDHLRRRPAAP
jgi:putative oxidoreductase